MTINDKILKLKAPLKDYIWGGTRLRDEFGRESTAERIAESWELSCHRDGMSVIDGGKYDGTSLDEYIRNNPSCCGKNCEAFRNFPVLIKLIDAKDDLSVQVHPDNAYAMENEGEQGKTEMWYIVDCAEGAELIYGFKNCISRDDFRRAIEENTLLETVNRVKVKKGDVFFIKSGTLHAIGKGILIAEIQQNSNTTYRVYDYGRTDANGNTRELHIDKALDVTELTPAPQQKKYEETVDSDGTKIQKLAECEYFTVTKAVLENSSFSITADELSFRHVLVLSGEGSIDCGGEKTEIRKGDSFFIPAGTGKTDVDGSCEIIVTAV